VRRVSGWDLAFWVVIVAIVGSLVRPASKAGAALVALVDALAAVVGEATGYTQRNI
jgi:dolichol kinase